MNKKNEFNKPSFEDARKELINEIKEGDAAIESSAPMYREENNFEFNNPAKASALFPSDSAVITPIKVLRKASPASLGEADIKRNVWRHTSAIGVTIEDVLDPGYFCNTIKKLRVLDRIEVVAEDMTFFAELLVLDVLSMSAKVHLLAKYDLAKTERRTFENDVHKIEWMGAEGRFSIIRKSDKALVQNGFTNIIDAQKWLLDHERALSA